MDWTDPPTAVAVYAALPGRRVPPPVAARPEEFLAKHTPHRAMLGSGTHHIDLRRPLGRRID